MDEEMRQYNSQEGAFERDSYIQILRNTLNALSRTHYGLIVEVGLKNYINLLERLKTLQTVDGVRNFIIELQTIADNETENLRSVTDFGDEKQFDKLKQLGKRSAILRHIIFNARFTQIIAFIAEFNTLYALVITKQATEEQIKKFHEYLNNKEIKLLLSLTPLAKIMNIYTMFKKL